MPALCFASSIVVLTNKLFGEKREIIIIIMMIIINYFKDYQLVWFLPLISLTIILSYLFMKLRKDPYFMVEMRSNFCTKSESF